jgi:hypothetical protein
VAGNNGKIACPVFLRKNMTDILADYREWRDAQPSHVGTHSDRCHMWHRDCLIHRLAAALAAEQAKRTPQPHATPSEGTRQPGCIVARLRAEIAWEADVGELLTEAADEIERLRLAIRRLAEQDATLSVQGGNVIVEMDATLTEEEREAIERVAIHCADTHCIDTAKTLWGLLERTTHPER